MKTLQFVLFAILSFSILFFSGCSKNDPTPENIKEAITKATLTFTPTSTGTPIVVTVTDSDGDGPNAPVLSGPIALNKNTTYTLAITLINELAKPTDPEYDVTAQVKEEADEHLFFFGWTNNIFSNPVGNGNIDARADLVNYNDKDSKNLPLGLNTTWTTINTTGSSKFRVLLKHQPELKSATSSSNDGESDLNVEFDLSVI